MAKKSKRPHNVLRLGKPERLSAGYTIHEHPAVAPDGRHFAYYAGPYGAIEIYVCDDSGQFARCLTSHGNNTQAAWHPRGDRISFRHQDSPDAKWQIWECPLVEGKPHMVILADKKWHYKHPYYSPDAKFMAYFSDEGSAGVFHIWRLNLKSGKREQLTFGDSQNHAHPVFSPSGQRIAFHAYEGTDENATPPVTNLYELDLKSGKVRQLSSGQDQFKHPFHFTETLITYHHERNSDGRRRLEAMDLVTCQRYPLTSGKNNDKHPFPFIDNKGHRWVYWSSKKLGKQDPHEPDTFDIFRARLTGKVKPGHPEKDPWAKGKSKRKPKKDWCKDCPQREVEKGHMTSWKQARKLGVKAKSKTCKDCPARESLGK